MYSKAVQKQMEIEDAVEGVLSVGWDYVRELRSTGEPVRGRHLAAALERLRAAVEEGD